MRYRWMAVAYVLVAAVWIAARVSVFSHESVIEFPDSVSYLTKAAEPLWTTDYFFGSGRFFVVPTYYKLAWALFGLSKSALTGAQLVLSLCAWIAFGWSVAAGVGRTWLGVLFFSAALAFGLGTDVIQWDSAILSESVSTSLFILLIALWIRLSERFTTTRIVCTIALAATWAMSREANSLLLLSLAAASLLWVLCFRRQQRRERILAIVLSCGLSAIFVASFTVSGSGDRWVFPLLNVIGKRVLPSPERTAFYQARGMPVNDRLMDMSGEFASGKNWAFYTAPELADFRTWLTRDGRKVYANDLVAHPIRSIVEPLQDVNEFVCPVLMPYWSVGFKPIYPIFDNFWFCRPIPAGRIVAASLLGGFVLITGVFLLRNRMDGTTGFRVLTVGTMLAGWLPFTWFTWHVIGQMEIGRHVWSGVMMCRVGAFLLLLYSVQIVLGPRLIERSN